MRAHIGEKFSEKITMTAEESMAFARAAHDFNPLHHDHDAAARSRYGRLIVSGAQTISRLMGLSATYFTKNNNAVGLDFSMRFHRPVYAGETVTLEWEIVDVISTSANGADVVSIKGRVLNEAGELATSAKGRVLVSDKI